MEAIKESMSNMNTIFNKKLAEFEERQQKLSAPTSPSQSNLEAEFTWFKSFTMSALRTLQSQVELLAQQMDNLEMHTRRKILLLHGIPEDKSEDTVSTVVKVVTQSLKLNDFQVGDVSRCHRMGRSSSADRPRPILFKLKDSSIRSQIWAAKINLKGSGITLSEFLTKTRHDMFMSARQRFGVTKCWTRDGSVFVVDGDGSRHRINCRADLDKIEDPPKAASVSDTDRAAATKAPPSNERSKRVPRPKLIK